MVRSRRWFTQTLVLTTAGTALAWLPRSRAQAQAEAPVVVDTTEAFLRAIGPNRTIQLLPGEFTLSDITPTWRSPYARFVSVFDGYELVISEVENLRIVGADNTLSRLLTRPRYADVLKFFNCRNISFDNLELAHTMDAGTCRGSVLAFANCDTVAVDRCVLFGSGTHGIEAEGLGKLTCTESIIRDCTYGILCFNQVSQARFERCQFFQNRGFSMIDLLNCEQVKFFDCRMYDNAHIPDLSLIGNDFMFNVMDSEGIELVQSQLHHNRIRHLAPYAGAIAILNTSIAENSFAPDSLYPTDDTYQSTPFCPV
ncbi:MAG: right-handed parallel beta-helix repeat-containing protein [Cyanobacteria bacterium P01_H01_bin.58]